MNRTDIDWCDFTWNPVVGCKHGCFYCYARMMNKRFKMISSWENPEFFCNRLAEKVPSLPKRRNPIAEQISLNKPVIFAVSMGDLMGSWVPAEWINQVIDFTRDNPQAVFMILTKNGKRYHEFSFPENCYLGVSATTSVGFNSVENIDAICELDRKNKTFLSLEPILGSFSNANLKFFDFIIVGAMTGPGALPPKKEWISSIDHPNVYLKNSIIKNLYNA